MCVYKWYFAFFFSSHTRKSSGNWRFSKCSTLFDDVFERRFLSPVGLLGHDSRFWFIRQCRVFSRFSETVATPEKKAVDSPVKEKKVPDSPAKVVESPVKEKAAENGSAKVEEEDDDDDDDDVKENGASEEEEEDDDVVEKEQNGDSKGRCLGV